MLIRKRWSCFLLPVVMMALAGLACSFGIAGPTPPASPIAISTEAAGELQATLESALENSKNGEVTVVITEQQITSLVAIKLAEESDPPIKDIQVYLRDGQMMIFGTALVRGVSAPATIKLDIVTTLAGDLDVTVADADFGPLPVPSAILDGLSTGLNEMLDGEFGPQTTGFIITAVTIADGQMTVTGTAAS